MSARQLPRNLEAEASLLGGIILRNACLAELSELEPDHFFDPRHRVVFTAMRNLEAAAQPMDVVTLEAAIDRAGKLDAIGGVGFLGELVVRVPTADNVRAYAGIVLQLSRIRHASVALGLAHERIKLGICDPDQILAETIADLQRLEPKPAGTDPFDEDLKAALADVRAVLGTAQSTKRSPLFGVDAAALLSEEFTTEQWLVSGLITRGGTAVISGIPKAAKKTWLAVELAVAVATGTKSCGEFFTESGRAVYFFAEDTRRQIRNRARALLAGADRLLAEGRLHLQPRGEFLDVLRDEDLAWIVASVRKLGSADLLVLDPLRDVHGGEEDKSDSMRDVMRRLRLLGELLGCTTLAVHHAGKPGEATAKRGGGQRMRGSGAIHGSTDSGIHFLECEGDGTNVFTNVVESEVKGARSAGIFKLELRIEDDNAGEATRATWTATREPVPKKKASARAEAAEKVAARAAADDERVFAFVRELAMRGVSLSRRALRDHDEAPIAVNRMTAALDRLIDVDRLQLIGRDVKFTEPSQGDRP